jgi:hypothetical protein
LSSRARSGYAGRLEAALTRALIRAAPWARPLAVASGLAIAVVTLAWALSPACRCVGVVRGELAPFWYRIEALGRPIHYSTAEAGRILAALPIMFSIFLIVGLAVLRYIDDRAASEVLLGASMGYLPIGTVPVLLEKLVERACRSLDVDLVYRTSAGLVNLGETSVYYSRIHGLLASPHVYMALATAFLAFSLIDYMRAYGYLEQRGAGTA